MLFYLFKKFPLVSIQSISHICRENSIAGIEIKSFFEKVWTSGDSRFSITNQQYESNNGRPMSNGRCSILPLNEESAHQNGRSLWVFIYAGRRCQTLKRGWGGVEVSVCYVPADSSVLA